MIVRFTAVVVRESLLFFTVIYISIKLVTIMKYVSVLLQKFFINPCADIDESDSFLLWINPYYGWRC